MRRNIKYMRYLFTTFTLCSILLLSLFNNINFTHAQVDREPFPVYSDFTIIELADNINSTNDISVVDIPLPSNTWNITNIEMNFTDIKLGKEIKDLEVNGKSISTVYSRGDLGYGVEINLSEPTIIFGVYIFGYRSGYSPVQPVYVQITGYNIPTNTPNFDIKTSTLINISTIPMWYHQNFENETTLLPGNYYLTLNGSELTFPTDRAEYNWFYNGSGSIYTNLHTAVYNGISWSEEDVGKPFLYKLIQRVDRSLNPEEINMSVDVAGINYPIGSNGSIIVNQNIFPNSTDFNIPIFNNKTLELLFNLSYHIKLQNFLITEGFTLIQENLVNTWTLSPEIERYFYNYSVKFFYPRNWYNLRVESNQEDITSSINITSDFIFIPDNIITIGSSWDIYAESPNILLSLNIPKLKFGPGQEMQFSILPPIMPGIIEYELYNSLGFPVDNHTFIIETIETEEIVLTYQIPSNPNEGIYKTFIFWYNATDAGVVTQEFTISVPFVLDPMIIVTIAVTLASLSIFSFTTYKVVKRSKRKHEAYRQSIFNKYMDVLNLDYFIVTHKKSGLNVYEEVLAGKSIDVSLITGFLEAIRSFGIELTGTGEQSQTIKLEYHQSKILMSEFKNFRILLIMKENPSQDFLESIKDLSHDIDNKYGKLIEHFSGNVTPFKGIRDLTEQNLQTSLIYPLQIIKQDLKLKSDEKAIVNRANIIMKKQNKDYFSVTSLLSIRKEFDAGEAETILNLIKKKVFQPKI